MPCFANYWGKARNQPSLRTRYMPDTVWLFTMATKLLSVISHHEINGLTILERILHKVPQPGELKVKSSLLLKSPYPSTLSLWCAWVERWGWGKDTCLCVYVQRQPEQCTFIGRGSYAFSILPQSVLTLCHNLDSRDFDHISFPYHQTSFHRWLIHCLDILLTMRGKQLPNKQEVVYPKHWMLW